MSGREALARLGPEVRRRLGLVSKLDEHPLVSIVVPSRDGVEYLRTLIAGLTYRTAYPKLELIVVDNGSSDGSIDFLRHVETPFPVSIRANANNESFSDSCNMGAQVASGELLLFLNNDIEPFELGWLEELVACLRNSPEAGAVGATLIDPEPDPHGDHAVQTRQVWLARDASGELGTSPNERRKVLFEEGFGVDVDTVIGMGACILIQSALFEEIGGYTHGYFYSAEDVDLLFKVQERGLRFIYSGRSILAHRGSASLKQLLAKGDGSLRERNRHLVGQRWGPRLWREYELDRLAGGGRWAAPDQAVQAEASSRAQVEMPGFCLLAGRLEGKGKRALEALELELARRGQRQLTLRDGQFEDRALYYDIAVHLRGGVRHVLAPGQLNVLWIVDSPSAVSGIECRGFDLVATDNAGEADRMRKECGSTPIVFLGKPQPESLIEAALGRMKETRWPLRVVRPQLA